MMATLSPAAARKGLAQVLSYASYPQQVAVQLDDHGCGFCFYESGRVAACINKVNDYQRRFQFFEDNSAKTLLATIDEHAIGSAGRPKGKKILLTKDGGLLLDASDQTTKRWRWDPKAQHAGSPPQEPVVIPLNDSLLFTYKDRHQISVTFSPGLGISVVLDCGETLRRQDTYLDHARRETHGAKRGQLLIDQSTLTLQQRQKQIELDSIAKRSTQRPQSKDLGHSQIKSIVASLEKTFDVYSCGHVTPYADGNWKESARLQSLQEIPMLAKTGTEVGNTPTLFGAAVQPHDAASAVKRLQHPENGSWLGSVEVHERILHDNPSLARKGALSIVSGRYTRELPVAGYVDGRKPANGARLAVVSALKLDRFLRESCASDELVVVACLRMDDPQSCAMESLLEQVQHRLVLQESEPSSTLVAKCKLVKCDLAESSQLSDRYRIHAAPTFLLFYGARLVHVSSLGGASLRVFPATTNANLSNQVDTLPRVLLVEKTVKHQVAIEKMLRKETFQWDLAISGEQAVAFFTRLPLRAMASSSSSAMAPSPIPSPSTGYGLVLLSDVLDETELRSIDRMVRSREKSTGSSSSFQSPLVVCAIVSSPLVDVQFASSMCSDCRKAQGRRASIEAAAASKKSETLLACPHCGIITSESKASSLVSPVLAEVAHVLVYKHVKPATLHRLAERWLAKSQSPSQSQSHSSSKRTSTSRPSGTENTTTSFTGLTVESFFKEMEKHYATAKRGVFLPENSIPAMALSIDDSSIMASATGGGPKSERKPSATNASMRSSSA